MRSAWTRIAAPVGLVALAGLACDAPSQPPPSDAPPPSEPPPVEPAASPKDEPAPEVEPPPSEPPAPVGGPHCDQRERKHMCVDFTAHTGVTEVRCFEGTSLSEGACPSEGVVARCTLPSTGVVLHHYEGAALPDASDACDASGGRFE